MKQLIIPIVCAAVLLTWLAAPVLAEQGRPYFSLLGGANLMNDVDLSDRTGNYAFEMEPGLFFAGALGYDLGDGYPQLGRGRIELELGYRYNELDKAKFTTGSVAADGDITALSLMFNAIADYPEFSPYYVPFFGLGVGLASISFNDTNLNGSPMLDDDAVIFAYQALAGASFEITDRFAIDCGYRYFGTLDPELTDSQGRRVDAEYGSHSVTLGVRFSY